MDALALIAQRQQLLAGLGLIPVCGIELEFYVVGEEPDSWVRAFKAYADANPSVLSVEDIKPETGLHQYEAEFGPTLELTELVAVVERFRTEAGRHAREHAHDFICKTRPYVDHPDCGLHVHISLVNQAHENLFARCAGEETDLLRHAVGGLLETLPAAMRYLAPEPSCYARYRQIEGRKYMDTPTTVSWGGNNRTVAIRIPESTLREHTRRIEHRVPCVEGDVAAILAVLLCGVYYGIAERCSPSSPKIYGYASDIRHALPVLPQSLEEALRYSHRAFDLL